MWKLNKICGIIYSLQHIIIIIIIINNINSAI